MSKKSEKFSFTSAIYALFYSAIAVVFMYLCSYLRKYTIQPLIDPFLDTNPILYEILFYLERGLTLVIIFLLLIFLKGQRKYFKGLIPSRRNRDGMWFLIGIVTGFIMNAIPICAAIINGDIDMVVQFFSPLLLIVFMAVIVQAGSEEVVFRMWNMNVIKQNSAYLYAVIFSSVAFSVIHFSNEGITFIAALNLFLIAVFYALCYHYTGSIWLPIAHHTMWNFSQNCIFGLPNSGFDAVITLMAPTKVGESFAYDPVFGVEGTIVTSAIYLIAILIVLIIVRKNRLQKSVQN